MNDKDANTAPVVETNSSPKNSLYESSLGGIGCGGVLLICNIAAGILFWQGWPVWLILGFVGYIFLWVGLTARLYRSSRLVFAFFTLSNFSIIYFGNLLIDRNIGIFWLSFILNGIFGYLLVFSFLRLLIPKRSVNLDIGAFSLWVGLCIFVLSLILNHLFPAVWIAWLLIDLLEVGILGSAVVQISVYLGNKDYKDVLSNQLAASNLLILWASISWVIYPERLWLWVALVFCGMLMLVTALENFLRIQKDGIRHQLIYVLNCLIAPLLFLWVAWRTWGILIPIIIAACYALLLLAIRQSYSPDTENQEFKLDTPTWRVFLSYLTIACMLGSIIWYFAAPSQLNNAAWLGFGGYLFSYTYWLQEAKAKAKVQDHIFPLRIDPINGIIGISILAFGWNNAALSRVLVALIGVFALACLERFGADLKKNVPRSFSAIFIGLVLFVVGIWMGQTVPHAYILQVALGFEGVWILLKGAGVQDRLNRFIDIYPLPATICFFLVCFLGFEMCLSYLFNAALEQQTLGYNILFGVITYILVTYPTTYLIRVSAKTLQLILEEIQPGNKAWEKLTIGFNKWKDGA